MASISATECAPSELAALSPYLTEPINRFGRYELELERHPPELTADLWS